MKALAEGKSLFTSGYVSNVEYNGMSNDVSFCYVRGRLPLDSDREMEQGTVSRAKMSNKQYTKATMQ